jgi:hypothetical protein
VKKKKDEYLCMNKERRMILPNKLSFGGMAPEARAVSPNQSGVTTSPQDGVTVILVQYHIF